VAVDRSEIRAIGWVVKLPVEMLQHCSSVSCMRTPIIKEQHYNRMSAFHGLYSEWPYADLLVFRNILLTLRGPLLHEFHHQLYGRFCLNDFGLFGKCLCIHCFYCSLLSIFTNENQVSSRVTMQLQSTSPSLWYRSKNVKEKAILCILCPPVSISGPNLRKTCDSLAKL
jgi:hypothetical protein